MKINGKYYTTTKLYPIFWEFAYKRQTIFRNRLENASCVSSDPILSKYKFTNTYRVLDRTSQYLVKHIVNKSEGYSDSDLLFRILFFKTFNKIETWESVQSSIGDISWSSFDMGKYKSVFKNLVTRKNKVYSAAYIMPSGVSCYGSKIKYENHLKLLSDIMHDDAANKINHFKTMEDVFNYLLGFPMIGKFLAYQYCIDINYSRLTDFDENDFVVPGPGSIRGIRKAFGENGPKNGTEIIKSLTICQEEESIKMGFSFPGLSGRKLKQIDIQNLFCEFDKYTREYCKETHSGGKSLKSTRIKQLFNRRQDSIEFEFPTKWGNVWVK